jgi:hypothetical protein
VVWVYRRALYGSTTAVDICKMKKYKNMTALKRTRHGIDVILASWCIINI